MVNQKKETLKMIQKPDNNENQICQKIVGNHKSESKRETLTWTTQKHVPSRFVHLVSPL